MLKIVERFEDMSQSGRLRIFQQDDGDMIVEIVPDQYGPWESEYTRKAEFCSVGSGGGKSPRTVQALRALMEAMAEDNKDPQCAGRRGEIGMGGTKERR